MGRRILFGIFCAAALCICFAPSEAKAQEHAYGRTWGGNPSSRDMNRFYHYPYVYYPQNFWGQDYYRSSENQYYRYPPEMRIPIYNRQWHNEYPQSRRYHSGHQFMLDVF